MPLSKLPSPPTDSPAASTDESRRNQLMSDWFAREVESPRRAAIRTKRRFAIDLSRGTNTADFDPHQGVSKTTHLGQELKVVPGTSVRLSGRTLQHLDEANEIDRVIA